MTTETLIDRFRATFDRKPEFVARAPGRIEVIGNHTDYNGGPVLGAAIDRDTWVGLARRKDLAPTIRERRPPGDSRAWRRRHGAPDGHPVLGQLPAWSPGRHAGVGHPDSRGLRLPGRLERSHGGGPQQQRCDRAFVLPGLPGGRGQDRPARGAGGLGAESRERVCRRAVRDLGPGRVLLRPQGPLGLHRLPRAPLRHRAGARRIELLDFQHAHEARADRRPLCGQAPGMHGCGEGHRCAAPGRRHAAHARGGRDQAIKDGLQAGPPRHR